MKKAAATTAISLLCLAALIGCETMRSASAPARASAAMSDAAGRAMVRTELIFGLSRDDGSGIDEPEWLDFVDKAVSVWFPSGFTITDGTGRWRDDSGKVLEKRSKVLLIFHDGSDANLRKIDELRRLYTQRFGPQTVFRASTNAWVAF